jgi:holo-[acyl-carrier protein] synthase
VDVVEVSRIRRAGERTGEAFLRRVFTPGERSYCNGFPDPWPHLASRFSAKESVIKALGFTADPLEIEVIRPGSGPPGVLLHGAARRVATERGILDLRISMSHSGNIAVATALALGRA